MGVSGKKNNSIKVFDFLFYARYNGNCFFCSKSSIAEDHYAAAADVQKNYTASENIDALIDKAREEMERAAKSLDFLAAAKFRDRMYELQKLREENRNQNSKFTIHNS